MRTAGVEAARKSKPVLTTRRAPAVARHPDLIKRQFTAAEPIHDRRGVWPLVTAGHLDRVVPTWAAAAYEGQVGHPQLTRLMPVRTWLGARRRRSFGSARRR